MTGKMVELFSVMVGNPVTRKAIRNLLKRDNGSIKLDMILKNYAEGTDEHPVLNKLINTGLRVFGGDSEELKKKLKDPVWRRGFINVISGLVDFGLRKPFVPGAPFLIVWDVTYACNLKCKHCYSTAGKPWNDELTTEEALRVIKILAEAGVTSIAFSGGEPLLRKDFFELVSLLKEYGVYVAVATNGTLLTEGMVSRLKSHGVEYVQISLDGLKETHEQFRGIAGIYDRVVEGIRNAVNAGLTVCISTTATRLNLDDVPEMMSLAEKLGVKWFMLYNYIPTGRGDMELDIDPYEREKLLRMLWNRMKETDVNFMSTAPYYARVALESESNVIPTHFYNPELNGKLKSLGEFIGGCGCGRFYLALRANGDINPCVFFPLWLENIKNFEDSEEFLLFWKENNILKDLRDKDSPVICGDCRYRYVCGGCRARAFAYFNDYMSCDPGCVIANGKMKKIEYVSGST